MSSTFKPPLTETVDSSGNIIITPSTITPPPPPPVLVTPPVLTGWGGIRADHLPGNAGALQSEFALMQARGYNCARIWIHNDDFGTTATVDQAKAAIDIARSFGFWVIIDWHGYTYPSWSDWLPFVQALMGYYDKLIWQPMNEPGGQDKTNTTFTTKLAAWQLAYQTWINNARAMGDNHFIIVENLNYVDMSHAGTAYAALTDPLNALYASFHDYYFFKYHPAWSIADADSFASMYLAQVDLAHNQPWAHRFITSELGAGPGPLLPPDDVIAGSAGYAPESLEFLNQIVKGLQSRGYSYMFWPGGDWTDTPGAGATVAMHIWGQLIGQPITPPASITYRLEAPLGTISISGATLLV